MSLTIDLLDHDVVAGTALARISGEIDARTCPLLEAILSPLPAGGVRHLLIDACALRFCAVAGARALQALHARLRAAGGEMIILTSARMARVLALHWRHGSGDHPLLLRSCDEPRRIPDRHLVTVRSVRGSSPLRHRRPRTGSAPPGL